MVLKNKITGAYSKKSVLSKKFADRRKYEQS